MDRYISEAFDVPPPAPHTRHDRVDLELRGVEHLGDSFAVRVFLNDEQADDGTATTGNPAYAGSFHIFGHGPCFGEEDHCEVPSGPVSAYDFRTPHPLTPLHCRIPITDALRAHVGDEGRFKVTLVPVANHGGVYKGGDLLRFKQINVIAYS